MAQTLRTPRVGDIVGIAEQPGTWVVSGISHSDKQANLGKIGSQKKDTRRVAWGLLTYRDELDESQNAARIVREATTE
jgi:hypothetical protein